MGLLLRREGRDPSEFAPILSVISFLGVSGGRVFERRSVNPTEPFSLKDFLISSVSVKVNVSSVYVHQFWMAVTCKFAKYKVAVFQHHCRV